MTRPPPEASSLAAGQKDAPLLRLELRGPPSTQTEKSRLSPPPRNGFDRSSLPLAGGSLPPSTARGVGGEGEQSPPGRVAGAAAKRELVSPGEVGESLAGLHELAFRRPRRLARANAPCARGPKARLPLYRPNRRHPDPRRRSVASMDHQDFLPRLRVHERDFQSGGRRPMSLRGGPHGTGAVECALVWRR